MASHKIHAYWTLIEAQAWIEKQMLGGAVASADGLTDGLTDLWDKLQCGLVTLFGCVDGAEIEKIPPVTLTAYKMVTQRTDAFRRPLARSTGTSSIWLRSKRLFPGDVVKDRSWCAGVAFPPELKMQYFREISNARVAVSEVQRVWPATGKPAQNRSIYTSADIVRMQRIIEAEIEKSPDRPKTKDELIAIIQKQFQFITVRSRAFSSARDQAISYAQTFAPKWAQSQPGRPRKATPN